MFAMLPSVSGVILFVFFHDVGLASPLSSPLHDHGLTPRGSDSTDHPEWGCPFPGNSDLYGLGIRLGVYLQLFSTLLANCFLSREVREEAHNTNAIIMIAIFAGMASATIRDELNAVEIFVMSTLLMAFLWSEFTPRHISGYVLFSAAGKSWDGVNKKRLYRERRENCLKGKWVIDFPSSEQEINKPDLVSQEGQRNSYFNAILRSIFGTAVGLFSLWFWLYARHTLLKKDITDPVCVPTVFLHSQIELNGYKPMAYVIFTALYAAWEVIFMAWWILVLAPGTICLLYDVLYIIVTAICTVKFGKLREIRSKFAVWYLGFAQLDDDKLRWFSFLRMKPKNQELFRRIKFHATWWGLPAGYSVIIWSTLAIEMTLAWNRVSGIYALGSTGQLIPFVVGVLGLCRNLHLIAVKISEGTTSKKKKKKLREREISVSFGEGKFFYGDGKDRNFWLEAGKPVRRRSIDWEVPLPKDIEIMDRGLVSKVRREGHEPPEK